MRLCTICARGGSKGVPGKNLREIGGLPLLAHSIIVAKRTNLFDVVAVDSDSPDILDVATRFDVDLTLDRPPELATDTAGKLDVIARAARCAEERTGWRFDTIVDLDATSPLRSESDVVGAVDLLESSGAQNVISVAPAHRSPYFNLVELAPDGTIGLSKPSSVQRRQDGPICYDLNASIYAWARDPFVDRPFLFGERTLPYVMPRERSVDIDDALDVVVVESLFARRSPTGAAVGSTGVVR